MGELLVVFYLFLRIKQPNDGSILGVRIYSRRRNVPYPAERALGGGAGG